VPPELALRTFVDTLPGGTRVLDLGAGAGTFPYACYPELRVAALDVRERPDLRGRFVRGSAHRIPFRNDCFDVIVAHWLFEHVDDLEGTMNEVGRVLRDGGLLAVAVPNSRSFEDRAYRFVSYVYKYALFQFRKRVEHVQTITFLSLNRDLYRRGFRLLRFREEGAGYCWLEIRQLKPFRAAFLALLGAARRLGIDLFAGANYRLVYRLRSGDDIEGRYLLGSGGEPADSRRSSSDPT
jgi:SAM-dependent methyltransferase